jgi:hypothetical protein
MGLVTSAASLRERPDTREQPPHVRRPCDEDAPGRRLRVGLAGGEGESPIETPEEARKLLDTIESKRQLHRMSRRMEKGSGGADMVWERHDGLSVSGKTFVQQFIHGSPALKLSEDGLMVDGRLWRLIR